jgi:hypothetical protein
MSSDVFIISCARGPNPAAAIRQAAEIAGVSPRHVQDVVFGLDDPASARPDIDGILLAAGLTCPWARVFTSLRAIFFAAASIQSDDAELLVVIGLDGESSTAFLLASPEAVGRLNLLPCARLAARSLAGSEAALRLAGLTAADVQASKHGERAAPLLYDLLNELESSASRWGIVAVGNAALLIERV